jgi:hypothetical protein
MREHLAGEADDTLRRRLDHLSRADTADSLPWPGVDDALRRRRRRTVTGAAAGAAIGTAAVVLAGSILVGGGNPTPTPAASPAPSAAPAPQAGEVPSAPYRVRYRDVKVSFPTGPAGCGKTYGVDLGDPAGSRPPRVVGAAGDDDLTVGLSCTEPDNWPVTSFRIPSVWMGEGTSAQPDPMFAEARADGGRCAVLFADTVLKRDRTYPMGGPRRPDIHNTSVCALLAADAKTGRPLSIVVAEFYHRGDDGYDVYLSAWTGGPPMTVRPTPPPTDVPLPDPPAKRIDGPYRVAYEDVTLRLPGRPVACGGRESFLDLQVPEVNQRLGPSDMMLTPPCDGQAAELQGKGVVLTSADVTAEACAAALAAGPVTEDWHPEVGQTLCSLGQPHLDGEKHKIVALTVTTMNEKTAAFELRATAWHGTPVPE